MPTLKQLTCTVEWSGSNVPLQEFHPTYGDGFVQTYIAIPPVQTPFSVHLTSHGYIAPGLAMFVYMDGEYQCNRNRRNLKIPDGSTKPMQTEIDFRVRQKEELQPDYTFRGQQWKFQELNIVPDVKDALENPAPHNAEYLGTIEVVVLRCYPAAIGGNSLFKRAATPTSLEDQPERTKYVYPTVSSDSSSDSDDEDSEDSSDSEFGGLFDGTCDVSPNPFSSMAFGGDATWETGDGWNDAFHGSSTGNRNPASKQEWNLATADTGSPPQWDTRTSSTTNHFSHDWIKPSQTTREPAQHLLSGGVTHGSRNRLRSSSSHHSSPAPMNLNEWSGGNANQPSPAIVINVNHGSPSSKFGPPSVASSWKSGSLPPNLQPASNSYQPPQGNNNSPNGSNHSGSSKSDSNRSGSKHSGNSDGSKKNSGGSGWQAAGGQNESWDAEAPHMPGSWDATNDKPQANTWNNDNMMSNTGWISDNRRQDGQNDNYNGNWNKRGAEGGWQGTNNNELNGQVPTSQWTNEQVAAAYPEWASPTVANHHQPVVNNNNNVQPRNPWVSSESNGHLQAQVDTAGSNVVGSGHGGGTDDRQPSQGQNFGANKATDDAGDVPIGLFGGKIPVPASESAKREGSILAKHSKNAQGFTFGAQSPTNAPASAPVAPFAKPYWSTWNHVSAAEEEVVIEPEPVEEPEELEGPVYSVPADVAQRNNTSHQVQVGKPAVYLHKMSKPKYMDSHDNPYAAFTFHYRSRAVIEKMFNVSLTETEEEKERLSCLSKEELIEQYLKAKASKSSQNSSGSNDSKNQSKVTNAGLGFGGELAEKLAQLNAGSKESDDKMSVNPELHWGRSAPQGDSASWNKANATANDNVTGWLTNGGGGGIANSPVASPPQNGSVGHDNANRGTSWSNGNQVPGNVPQLTKQWTNDHGNGSGDQHGVPWNGNGNSWNNDIHGSNHNKNQNANTSSLNNNGSGNHHGGSLKGSGTGNHQHGYTSSWNNNSRGNQGGGSLKDGQQGRPTGGSWKGSNQSGQLWAGGSGNQQQGNWNDHGQGNTSWNAAGGGNPAGANAEADVEW